MMRYALLMLVGFVLVTDAPAHAARPPKPEAAGEPSELQAVLEREIVGSLLPMAEVQRYCEDRVPLMPEVKTAAEWEAEAKRLRSAVLEQIVYRGEAAGWRDAQTKVEWLQTIDGGPGYRIKKLRYEALPGMWIPALLYEPEKVSGKVPAILNVNGHTALGKQYPPKQIRCINQAKRGMLALNVEWLGMGQLGTPGFSHARMNQLDLCGTSGLAPFYLAMKRGLDVLVSLEHADPSRVAVTGLSGGGWQTIVISPLDTRVKLADPVAGYSSYRTRARHLKDLGDSEQTPNDLAGLCDYTHLTAMMAPRPTLLTYNSKDNCCFESGYALQPLLDAAKPIFRLYEREDALRSHVNDDPGTHNYEVDNRQALYRMLGDFFYQNDEQFDPKEIPSDDEVKSKEELAVELPEKNEDFNTLALSLCKDLPRGGTLPQDKEAALEWQQAGRAKLRQIVRAKDYDVHAIPFEEDPKGDVKATLWKFQMGGAWTVPAVELVRGDPKKTAILVADGGRRSTATEAERLLDAGHRVLAVDPFYFGESKIAEKDYLFALLVAGVGDRPLGLQASQVAAVARWSLAQHKTGPVTLVALGPRSGTFALVAAALEPSAIGRVQLHNSLGSLKEVIEQNWTVNEKPELFCFGLLEAFDVEQLAALVAPRPVELVGASERARSELADLGTWYRLLGSPFDPLPRKP
jgi:dienelactone hydrolase